MVRTRALVLLLACCSCGGFSSEELGLVASWVAHGMERTRLEVEGLDVSSFGSSSLVVDAGGQFQVAGEVASSCAGKAAVAGSGRLQQERFDYLVNLTLDGWGSCDGEVALDGTVHMTVTAEAVTVAGIRDRPATAQADGSVDVSGTGIDDGRRGETVYFDLTMESGDGPAPTVCGEIDGEQICD